MAANEIFPFCCYPHPYPIHNHSACYGSDPERLSVFSKVTQLTRTMKSIKTRNPWLATSKSCLQVYNSICVCPLNSTHNFSSNIRADSDREWQTAHTHQGPWKPRSMTCAKVSPEKRLNHLAGTVHCSAPCFGKAPAVQVGAPGPSETHFFPVPCLSLSLWLFFFLNIEETPQKQPVTWTSCLIKKIRG